MECSYIISKDCKLISRKNGSLIYDLRRQCYYDIDNNALALLNKLPIKGNHEQFCFTEFEIKFLQYMIDEEIILKIPSNLVENFIEIDTTIDYGPALYCMTIQIGTNERLNFISEILEKVYFSTYCQVFEFQIEYEVELFHLKTLLLNLQKKNFTITINLTLLNSLKCNIEDLKLLINGFQFIKFITIFNNTIDFVFIHNNCSCASTRNNISENEQENYITTDNFSVNYTFYHESLSFNPSFYRKLYLNHNDDILFSKNHPSIIGNLQKEDLSLILSNIELFTLWNTPKLKITQCKDCKYNHMCDDFRIPQFINGEYSYSTDCKQFYK